MARDGLRLASSIDVRPGRGDLVAFLTAAAEQLHGCGIELDVHAVDSSGATLLAQLEYPNRFETVLVARTAGDDPDADLGQLQSRHITTEDNPGDGNIGGWVDGTADALIDAAAAASDPAARTGDYRALEALVARQVPLLPICWDLAWSATSHRLRIDGTPVDPSRPNYQRELTTWQLAGP
jgi:ABC-type transport system substrate-binding protein